MDTSTLDLPQATSGLPLSVAYLAFSLWITATSAAWILGLRALVCSMTDRRRPLVNALRWGTWAASVDLFGLIVMVAMANPVRYRTGGWLLSLAPLGLAVVAVIIGTRAPATAES
jgi:hypothetical protein